MSGERSESESEGAHMSGRASTAGDRAREGNFPAGLRVIVVDDDPLCLRVVERMLQRCSYRGAFLQRERKREREILVNIRSNLYVHVW